MGVVHGDLSTGRILDHMDIRHAPRLASGLTWAAAPSGYEAPHAIPATAPATAVAESWTRARTR